VWFFVENRLVSFDLWLNFTQSKNSWIVKDTQKHQGLRNQLAALLEQKGIQDKLVLQTLEH
jgi:hypothetical protein